MEAGWLKDNGDLQCNLTLAVGSLTPGRILRSRIPDHFSKNSDIIAEKGLCAIMLGRAGEPGTHQRVGKQYNPLATTNEATATLCVSSRAYACCSAY